MIQLFDQFLSPADLLLALPVLPAPGLYLAPAMSEMLYKAVAGVAQLGL
jgi:hypothetical protein